MLPANQLEFIVAFLPGESRRLTRTGVQIHNLQYWNDALESLIGAGVNLLVHYDPRDITYVYVRLSVGVVVKAGVTTPDVSPISLVEWQSRRSYERSLSRAPKLLAKVDESQRRADGLVSQSRASRGIRRRMATQQAGDRYRSESTPSVAPVDQSGGLESNKSISAVALSERRKIFGVEDYGYDY
jgi:Mu transposase, C-terminal